MVASINMFHAVRHKHFTPRSELLLPLMALEVITLTMQAVHAS